MKPRTLDRLTAASLLLFLAIAFLWALSFGVPAGADLRRPRWRVGFSLRGGAPSLRYQSAAVAKDLAHFHLNVAQPRWKRCGAELRTGRRTGVFWCDVLLPWWLLPTAAGLLPACLLVARGRRMTRERARVIRCLCPCCAYDLRGSLSGICPECGAMSEGTSGGPAARPVGWVRCPGRNLGGFVRTRGLPGSN